DIVHAFQTRLGQPADIACSVHRPVLLKRSSLSKEDEWHGLVTTSCDKFSDASYCQRRVSSVAPSGSASKIGEARMAWICRVFVPLVRNPWKCSARTTTDCPADNVRRVPSIQTSASPSRTVRTSS